MAVVTVVPDTFALVNFDAGVIAQLVATLADEVGLPADAAVTLEIDESVPLGSTQIRGVDPVHIWMEGGALENPKQPRHMSPEIAAGTLGRLLLRVVDRRGGFANAPPDSDLTLEQHAAWDAYCMGRLDRLGHGAQRQRRLYAFRTRHTFTDTADSAFERLWNAEGLTWDELNEISATAAAAPV